MLRDVAKRGFCEPVGDIARHLGTEWTIGERLRNRWLCCESVGGRSERCYNVTMAKRLQAVGNSSGVIIDKPILELLKITPETELDISTDGERLIITPIRSEPNRKRKIAKAQERTLAAHERTFRKLAK